MRVPKLSLRWTGSLTWGHSTMLFGREMRHVFGLGFLKVCWRRPYVSALFPVFRPASSVGETCSLCSQEAWRKVEEVIFHDDPHTMRHPLTTYLCLQHFNVLMGLSK